MRTSTRFLALLTCCTLLGAAEYAVAPAPRGSDSGNGSASSPFATLGHALSRAGSGDTVHLLRGATYRVEPGLRIPDGVTLVGSGPESAPRPVVTTSVVVPKLAEGAGGILTAAVDQEVLAVWVDGRFCRLARFPNHGSYLRVQEGSDWNRVVLDAAALGGAQVKDWNGGQLRWRRWSWWWETRPITGVGGNALSLGSHNRFDANHTGINSACYVDGVLAELDAPGEWHWAGGTLSLIPPAGSGDQPLVEVLVAEGGLGTRAGSVRGVAFERMWGDALGINGKAVIEDCAFRQISRNAIGTAWDAAGATIRDCEFRDVRNVAISWNENPGAGGGSVIEGCTFERIGMEFGYGGSGAWHAAGIVISNADALAVRGNRFVDVGYAGVILGCDGLVVERNVFVRCMGSLNDGAAIYANSSGNTIRDNIILDTVGNLDTSHWWYPLGHGIWPEFLSDFRDQVITGNVVVGSGGNGLFLTNNYHCTVSGNVLADNRLGALHLSGHGKTGGQNHTISDNVLISQSEDRRPTYREFIPSNWSGNDFPRAVDFEGGIDYGSMSGTTVVVAPGVPVAAGKGGARHGAVAEWAASQGWADQGARELRAASLLLINDTDQPHAFEAPRGGWSLIDGSKATGEIAVEPFACAVLVKAGSAKGVPPYILASGIDYRGPDGGLGAEPGAARAPGEGAAGDQTKGERPERKQAERLTTGPTDEAAQRWLTLLRSRTEAGAKTRRPPRFESSVVRSVVEVTAIDGDTATMRMAGGAAMQVNLFGRLAPADAASLSAALVTGADDLEGNAMAAFYARCAGDQVAYRRFLAAAGSFGDEVEAGFK